MICGFLMGSCKVKGGLPKTNGELYSDFSYVPIDPLPIFEDYGKDCSPDSKFKDLLESLPDQSVRLAIVQLNGKGSASYGPASIGYENNYYKVVLDYINVDVAQLPVYVKRISTENKGQTFSLYDESLELNTKYIVTKATKVNPYKKSTISEFSKDDSAGELIIVPVYVGVGLRLTASIKVIKGNVNLSSLGSLAAAAEAGKLTGSLTVQTLGITGSNVSSSLPLPSEINQTTIQNAILSLGSIKAAMYNADNTFIDPRVVGIYNPIGGGNEVVNGIISVLAEEPITWYRPCIK